MSCSPPPNEQTPPSISIVVPTLNEALAISAHVEGLRRQGFAEIVVADGGSRDDTLALASDAGARLVVAAKGRANQMNAGAAVATGDVLVFLHADTRLPDTAAASICAALRDPRVKGGCFRLRFDEDRGILRLYGWASHLESYWTSFGDQAFFVRRSVFDELGGFPVQPLMEDVEMRLRLRRAGRFVKLAATATTSARRFIEEGLVRRQALNAAMLLAYGLGVGAERLKRFNA